ncbi:MAG: DUF2796 domain-containing protein [Bdellovibrionota bacterium]|nr:DUF2796 domain-containing protein [Bdellovibrionota bacterium]
MMKHFFILGTLLLSAPFAYGKKALKSHVHGHVKLSVVVDNKQAFIELEGPAESFLGFEHRPKTAKEKASWKKLKSIWNNKTGDMFSIEKSLSCSFQKKKIALIHEEDGHHDHGKKKHHDEHKGEHKKTAHKDDHHDDHKDEHKKTAHKDDHHDDHKDEHKKTAHKDDHVAHAKKDKKSAEHSEIKAEMYLVCKKVLSGSVLNVSLKREFVKAKEIEAHVLLQNGKFYEKEIEKGTGTLKL